MQQVRIFTPSEILRPGDPGPPDLSKFINKFLAQGDSWFSIGALPPTATTNLLSGLVLEKSACAVNCARPGKKLVHMVDAHRDPAFVDLLLGIDAMPWNGILLSGGGNDLIDALRTPPVDKYGKPIPRGQRLLLTPAERGNAVDPEDFVSEDGWQLFEAHLIPQFLEFVAKRDDPHSKSQGVPIVAHTYDFVTPRNAGAGLGQGPWLFPALMTYAVPDALWDAISDLFIKRLSTLMHGLQLPELYVVDTQGTCIRADMGSQGSNEDWANEIHPNRSGYSKLSKVFGAGIDLAMH